MSEPHLKLGGLLSEDQEEFDFNFNDIKGSGFMNKLMLAACSLLVKLSKEKGVNNPSLHHTVQILAAAPYHKIR